MDYIDLSHTVLNIEAISNLVKSPKCGAVAMFIGTTRDNFEGKIVSKLEYEAYEPMALKAMKEVCLKIREKYTVHDITIHHRLGDVPISEASLVIAISSPHRRDCLDAVSYAVDCFKAGVPIWKKEVYEGDEPPLWKENEESNDINDASDDTSDVECQEELPPHLIQIKANDQEVRRRINAFIDLKRSQANETNKQQFCLLNAPAYEVEHSCARVTAVYSRRKVVDSHVKVRRVINEVGPQTHGYDPGSGPPSASSKRPFEEAYSNGYEERLSNIEKHMKIEKIGSQEILTRLKYIEDRIMFLESISPEYFDTVKETTGKRKVKQAKKCYTNEEIDNKVHELEMKLMNSSSGKTRLGFNDESFF